MTTGRGSQVLGNLVAGTEKVERELGSGSCAKTGEPPIFLSRPHLRSSSSLSGVLHSTFNLHHYYKVQAKALPHSRTTSTLLGISTIHHYHLPSPCLPPTTTHLALAVTRKSSQHLPYSQDTSSPTSPAPKPSPRHREPRPQRAYSPRGRGRHMHKGRQSSGKAFPKPEAPEARVRHSDRSQYTNILLQLPCPQRAGIVRLQDILPRLHVSVLIRV